MGVKTKRAVSSQHQSRTEKARHKQVGASDQATEQPVQHAAAADDGAPVNGAGQERTMLELQDRSALESRKWSESPSASSASSTDSVPTAGAGECVEQNLSDRAHAKPQSGEAEKPDRASGNDKAGRGDEQPGRALGHDKAGKGDGHPGLALGLDKQEAQTSSVADKVGQSATASTPSDKHRHDSAIASSLSSAQTVANTAAQQQSLNSYNAPWVSLPYPLHSWTVPQHSPGDSGTVDAGDDIAEPPQAADDAAQTDAGEMENRDEVDDKNTVENNDGVDDKHSDDDDKGKDDNKDQFYGYRWFYGFAVQMRQETSDILQKAADSIWRPERDQGLADVESIRLSGDVESIRGSSEVDAQVGD